MVRPMAFGRDGRDKADDPLGQLEAALAAGAPPLLFLHGKERFLVSRAVDMVREAVLEPATRAFNYDAYDGKEATAPKVLSAARTLPMMARRRFVLVRDADDLNADQMNAFSDYLASPSPETCLCFVADKADTRLKFFTAFKKHGLLLKFDPLAERQLPGFVRSEAARRKVKLEAGAAERLAQEGGGDPGQLGDALQRPAPYVGGGAPVRRAALGEVGGPTRPHTVFELIDALGAGRRAEALTLLSTILAAREPALRLLAMIARHVRQLWVARELGGRPPGEIAAALGVPPFVATKLLEQARRLPAGRVSVMHDAIFETDRALKSSKLDDERHMEWLVLRICGG